MASIGCSRVRQDESGSLRLSREIRGLRSRAMRPQMARLAKRNEVRHVEPELGVLQQSDLFLNEAEALAAATSAAPAQESEPGIEVAPHKRKPLDPALPRDIVRHALPEAFTSLYRIVRSSSQKIMDRFVGTPSTSVGAPQRMKRAQMR
jgi:hypothetical protein